MDFIAKGSSHWYKPYIDTMKHFALVSIDDKERIVHVIGEHWNPDGPISKHDLEKHYEKYSEAIKQNGYRMFWAKTEHGEQFYEVDKTDIKDNSTTKLDKFFAIKVDKGGEKTLPKKNIIDEFDLWEMFHKISSKVSHWENYWYYRDKSKIPEIYESKEGFIAQKLHDCWNYYEFNSAPVEYNAQTDKTLLDELEETKRTKGEDHEFITMGEAFEFFLTKFE